VNRYKPLYLLNEITIMRAELRNSSLAAGRHVYLLNHNSQFKNHNSKIRIQKSGFKNQDSKITIQKSGFTIQTSNIKLPTSNFRHQKCNTQVTTL